MQNAVCVCAMIYVVLYKKEVAVRVEAPLKPLLRLAEIHPDFWNQF
jgi:hypothetical protein